jgi:monothiol glutaredoxin
MTDINETIRADINGNDVVLYMKGTPDAPQCGFSAQVVRILKAFGVTYKAVDVLADWEIRDGIKQFTNWPTIPQLYVKGEFVGGCDIVTEMVGSGELKALFAEKGIGSALQTA